MVDRAERMSDEWRDGETRDISTEMMRLTMVIAGKTFFDAEVDSVSEQVSEQMEAVQENFLRRLMPFSELFDNLPLPSNRRLNRAIKQKQMDEIMFGIIEERRKSGKDKGDLLSMLLLAHDEEGDGSGMSDKQLRDEAITMFFGGHETTSNALTWTWYLLSQHPDVEVKLHEEIQSVLQGRLPQFEDVPKLNYTSMVFAEAMRMYPPGWLLGRRLLSDYNVGGYTLPAGSSIFISQWVMHHDSRYFPEPFKFDPMRWTPEAKASRPKFCYFPFGGGPRTCIGEDFAWMEGTILLAVLAQQWRLHLAPGHQVETEPMLTLRVKHGLPMRLERREIRAATQNAAQSA
jgi:cytochrome P450